MTWYIVSYDDGSVTKTEDERVAKYFSESDNYVVINKETDSIEFEGEVFPIEEDKTDISGSQENSNEKTN